MSKADWITTFLLLTTMGMASVMVSVLHQRAKPPATMATVATLIIGTPRTKRASG